jgi:peptide/nickel transport system permease protein
MGQYIIRRLLIAIPTLLIISFIIFAILASPPATRWRSLRSTPPFPSRRAS